MKNQIFISFLNLNLFNVTQVDNPEDDIDDSINFPDIRFIHSDFAFDSEEPYPDAVLDHSWLVPDGGNLFYQTFKMSIMIITESKRGHTVS